MIKCEENFGFRWKKKCAMFEISRTAAVTVNPLNPSKFLAEATGTTFQINGTKLHVPIVTLSI